MKLFNLTLGKFTNLNWLFLWISFGLTQADAQSFKPYVIAGVSATQISGDTLMGYNKPGLLVGFGITRKLSKSWGFDAQLYYVQKGSRKQPNFDVGDYTAYYLNMHYVELPMLIHAYYKNLGLCIGPSVGGLLKFTVENQMGPFPVGSYQQKPFRPYELALNIGLTYALTSNFIVEFRNNRSALSVRPYMLQTKNKYLYGQFSDCLYFTLRYIFEKH